jgi:hypothetical protein
MITLKDIKREQWDLYVGLLTIEQKDSLLIQWYASDCYFNPIQDINDNWVISVEEMANCTNEEFIWVKELPLILYVPKENNFPEISLN